MILLSLGRGNNLPAVGSVESGHILLPDVLVLERGTVPVKETASPAIAVKNQDHSTSKAINLQSHNQAVVAD